ncbi:MAG: septum formation inhibitor Maf [Rhodocyclaceae bacterium]|nr:septum formation inhibitor Maf [Rhodocyclaceae bacterium]
MIPPRIYLASRSPRRRELLHQIGVQFDLLTFRSGERGEDADVDETPLGNEDAERYVTRVALTKAESGVRRLGWRQLTRRPVLSADTTLELDGRIIGKPKDAVDANRILASLGGRRHRVLTAVALSDGEHTRYRLNISEVQFRALDEDEIRRYVASGESLDKAGGYGIQGRAAMFVQEIHGSYSGIMGLPLFETAALLKEFDYPI